MGDIDKEVIIRKKLDAFDKAVDDALEVGISVETLSERILTRGQKND